jgi:PPM family protein phosphatase
VADTTLLVLPVIEHAFRTDAGRDPDKQTNEDACGHRETSLGHLAIVCDGMGGHLYGKEASEAALAAMFEIFDAAPPGSDPREVLRRSIEKANERVFAMAPAEAPQSRPGSTVVALLLHADGTEIAHVGDSRCYLIHAGEVRQMTRDHSIVEQLVQRGVLTPEQAKKHPDANRITRALGSSMSVEVEIESTLAHVAGDTLVLCSDGLSDLVEPSEILALAGEPPAQMAGRLVDLANAHGGHDNITVLVVRARESALNAPAAGVAPTIVQTYVQPTVDVTKPDSMPPQKRSKLPLVIGGVLAAVGVGIAILALAAALRPTTKHHAALDGGSPFVRPPPVVEDVLVAPSATAIEGPTDPTELLPRLHHPDGSMPH